MNKQDALKRIEIIEREAAMLRKIVEAPEEPKLRHGDFGIEPDEPNNPFVVIEQSSLYGTPKAFYANQSGQIEVNNFTSTRIIFGNVFDLMKGWSEPFEYWHSEKGHNYDNDTYLTMVIDINDHRPDKIWIGTCGNSAWYSRKDAKEIHNALGHAIAELKRKENKNV